MEQRLSRSSVRRVRPILHFRRALMSEYHEQQSQGGDKFNEAAPPPISAPDDARQGVGLLIDMCDNPKIQYD